MNESLSLVEQLLAEPIFVLVFQLRGVLLMLIPVLVRIEMTQQQPCDLLSSLAQTHADENIFIKIKVTNLQHH